jgi:hypothetical protein
MLIHIFFKALGNGADTLQILPVIMKRMSSMVTLTMMATRTVK